MSDVAIRVEGLGKRYRIGARQERHDTLRDAIADFRSKMADSLRLPGNLQSSIPNLQSQDFWALKDVSFEVKRGEVVGVIGRNGAGKSTLLKILSRITEPTEGRAAIHGRVGSLLEVGTGFHPELTGRENIYLNGAILGMRRTEIESKFDEIVAFSEIEKFLDTPVKRYSSGMYVRLAFAVAAHLEPEILLVDEVLAVGDAEFQKKCLGKMGDVAKEGRTVLFVSHNMGAISQLCPRVLLINRGCLHGDAHAESVIADYLGTPHEIRGPIWGLGEETYGHVRVRIVSVECVPDTVFMGDDLSILLCYEVEGSEDNLGFGLSLETAMGQRVFGSYTGREGLASHRVAGQQQTLISLPHISLTPGRYYVSMTIHAPNGENLIRIEQASSFEVMPKDLTGSGYLVDSRNGLVWMEHKWDLSAELVTRDVSSGRQGD